MGSRTISVPQRSGILGDPVLYETIARIVAGVNSALTVTMAPSMPTSPNGTLVLTNPVVRLVGGGTIRTIAPVDFDVPIYLISTTNDVALETGGNIGAAATIAAGSACALVREQATGLWWPIVGGSGGSSGTFPSGRTAATSAATVTAVGNVNGIDLTGATGVSNLVRSPAVYTHGEQMVIHNANAGNTITLAHLGGGTQFFFFPNGANLVLQPWGSAIFSYDAPNTMWVHLVPA